MADRVWLACETRSHSMSYLHKNNTIPYHRSLEKADLYEPMSLVFKYGA